MKEAFVFSGWKGDAMYSEASNVMFETQWQAWVVEKVINGERDFLNREAFITRLETLFDIVAPKPEEYGFPDVMASGLIAIQKFQKLVSEILELLQ